MKHSQSIPAGRRAVSAAVMSAVTLFTMGTGEVAVAAEGAHMLEEVVVTATRRRESIQEVPTSIVALTADDFAQRGITDLRDLSKAVSGIQINRPGNALGSSLHIRGVGTEGTSSAKKSVSLIYDGMLLERPGLALSEMLDITSVEVLRGPQGTLYGKNATSGVIRVTTADADPNEFSGKLQAVAGNLDAAEFRGVINIPLIEDTLAIRVSGFTAERDGLADNVLNGDDLHNVDRQGYRGKLLWNIIEDLQLRLSAEHTEDKGNDSSFVTSTPFFYTANGKNEFSQQYAYWDDDTDRYTANLRWMVADHALTVFYGKEESDSWINRDYDETPRPILTLSNLGELETETMEVQWTSSFDGPFNYLLGYFTQEQSSKSITEIPGVFAGTTPIEEESEAYFASASYEFSDQWKIQGGVRYSEDTVNGRNSFHSGDKTFDEWTWSAKLSYQVDDNMMIYGSYDKGYKQGGINSVPITPQQAFWDAEVAYNYELGIKSELMERSLRLNAAVFYTTYEDYQSTYNIPGIPRVLISNASEVESTGVEADFLWSASDLLTFNGSITYVQSEYEDFKNSPCAFPGQEGCDNGASVDLSGETLYRSPELTFNLGAELRSEFALIAGSEWFIRFDMSYTDDQNLSAFGEAYAEESAYTLANGRMGIQSEAVWALTIWSNNMFDEEYRTNGEQRFSNIRTGVNSKDLFGLEPTYGVTLDYAF